MLFKKAFGLVMLATFFTGTCRTALKAGCKVETLRACGEDYVPYGKEGSLPLPGKPLADKCPTWKQQLDCAFQFYDDCFQGVLQVAGLTVAKRVREMAVSICDVGSDHHKQYQTIIPCLNSVGGELYACFNKLKADLQRDLIKAPAKQILSHTCCSYSNAVQCFGQALAPCDSTGGKRLYLGFLDWAFGDLLKIACPNDALGAEACKSLAELPPIGPNVRKIDSLVELFTEIASQLGN